MSITKLGKKHALGAQIDEKVTKAKVNEIIDVVNEIAPDTDDITVTDVNAVNVITSGDTTTTSNVGTANTGVTAIEYGDGVNHTTVLTVSQAAALTLADNASIADGYLVYTLPAGKILITDAFISMTTDNAEHDTEASDVGLGTTIATGAVSVLGGTAGFENIMTGQTGAIGTADEVAVSTTLYIATAGAHTVHFNVAGAWADTAGAALDADIAGTIVLKWIYLGA